MFISTWKISFMLKSPGEAHQVKKFTAICGTKRLISVLILFILLALKILFIQFYEKKMHFLLRSF